MRDEQCTSERTPLVSSIMYRPSDDFEVIITLLYSSQSFVKSLLCPVAVSLSPAHQGEQRERSPLQPRLLQCTDIIQLKKHQHAGVIEI